MKLYLPALFLLICSFEFALSLRRNIIKVRASGFLPFESDLVLPLGILRQLQAQERNSRVFPSHKHYARPPGRWKTKPKPRKPLKQQLRLEPAHTKPNSDAHTQMYNLIDDDGELLLNLRVHNEKISSSSSNSNYNNNNNIFSNNNLENSAPWRPSKWRPTTNSPLRITSSSPRPLPLHEYLNENRRSFSSRQDWSYK